MTELYVQLTEWHRPAVALSLQHRSLGVIRLVGELNLFHAKHEKTYITACHGLYGSTSCCKSD